MIKMICLILGGGAGSRLFPLTEKRSKPAVPIGGKYRLIDIPISNCINSGVKRMFVLTQYNSASLNAHIKNTYNFDIFTRGFVDILAAEQTPSSKEWFQGTADAVRQSRQHYERQDFDYILLLSGDQLYQMDFESMVKHHIEMGADITIACLPVDARDATGFGIMKVNEEGYIPRFIEKPNADELPNWVSEVSPLNKKRGRNYLASMGIYIFNRKAISDLFDQYPHATDFGKEIIPSAIGEGRKVAAYQYEGYWTDIGTIHSFFEANIELTDHIPSFNLFDSQRQIYTRGRMLPPAKFYGGTQLNRALIAEGSIIHARLIEGSIIGLRSRLGENTVIKDSIVMGNDTYQTLQEIALHADEIPLGVGHYCHIEHAILDKDCRIGNNVVIKGGEHLPDIDTDEYCVRDGVVVVKKGAVLPEGTRIM
ncbi:MAG: glucose-1-phosphate adenylyltransferase [Haliscomenobacteraceae bacterium CHB4]|nr:Glucose-1-phosphate adenylyltransferase [Saprospiraceae bacterium]MCE7924232.1 glucose-1-phosphate adenylyltransferase [Haliscomenobacteraceae bacterium CHB4]